MEKGRNASIDYLKFISSFLVVYIHAGFNTGAIRYICQVAVPVFFILSGYLYETVTVRKGRQKKQIVRISKLFLISFFFYIVWSGLVFPLIKGEAVALGKQMSAVAVAKLVLLNAPTYGYHLWYLVALVYVLVIETAVDYANSEKLWKIADVSPLCLLAIGVTIPPVCTALNLPYRIEIVRNFLFEGYPMFHIGRIIAKKIAVKKTVQDKNELVSVKPAYSVAYLVITMCMLIALLIEQGIYDILEIQSALSVFTVMFAVTLVLWAVYPNPICEFGYSYKRMDDIRRNQTDSGLGGVLSTGIYIIHVFILSIINYLDFLEDGLLKTALCFCISALLVVICKQVNDILKKRGSHNVNRKIA